MRIKKIRNILLRPFKNKEGITIYDPIIWCICFLIVMSILIYQTINMTHNSVTGKVDKIASSMLDAIQENREINSGIIKYYQDDLNKANFYVSDYNITIKKINFNGSTTNSTTLVNCKKGEYGKVGSTKIEQGSIIRIEISSTNETQLTKITKYLGGSSTADVVGFAEGGID